MCWLFRKRCDKCGAVSDYRYRGSGGLWLCAPCRIWYDGKRSKASSRKPTDRTDKEVIVEEIEEKDSKLQCKTERRKQVEEIHEPSLVYKGKRPKDCNREELNASNEHWVKPTSDQGPQFDIFSSSHGYKNHTKIPISSIKSYNSFTGEIDFDTSTGSTDEDPYVKTVSRPWQHNVSTPANSNSTDLMATYFPISSAQSFNTLTGYWNLSSAYAESSNAQALLSVNDTPYSEVQYSADDCTCPRCRLSFESATDLGEHWSTMPEGCWKQNKCFPAEEALDRAVNMAHSFCFFCLSHQVQAKQMTNDQSIKHTRNFHHIGKAQIALTKEANNETFKLKSASHNKKEHNSNRTRSKRHVRRAAQKKKKRERKKARSETSSESDSGEWNDSDDTYCGSSDSDSAYSEWRKYRGHGHHYSPPRKAIYTLEAPSSRRRNYYNFGR